MFIISTNINRLEEILKARLLELNASVDSIKKQLSKYPKGMLKVRKNPSGFSYCIKDIDTKKIAYVRKENIKLLFIQLIFLILKSKKERIFLKVIRQ